MNELIFFSEFKLPKKLKFSKTKMKKNNLIKIFVFIKKKEKKKKISNLKNFLIYSKFFLKNFKTLKFQYFL